MAKIGIFAVISCGILTVLFAESTSAVSQTLGSQISGSGNKSTNGTIPALHIIPKPDNNESTIIWSRGENNTRYERWKAKLMSSLDTYYHPNKLENAIMLIMRCSYDYPAAPGKFCDVDAREWGPCNPKRQFDYNTSEPCIFLKLDRIYGWTPEYYNDPNDLPDDMPRKLKDHIRNRVTEPQERNNIWISCDGDTKSDQEILKSVEYYPSHGFPGFYFPYMNTVAYQSPLVAVRFKGQPTGSHLNIECRAWAKNIRYTGQDRKSGSVRFQIRMD